MSENKINKRVVNSAKSQQHPFHLLGSSKLPLFISAFTAGLLIATTIKIQNIFDINKLSPAGIILEPLFYTIKVIPNTELSDATIDATIIQMFTLILITIWS